MVMPELISRNPPPAVKLFGTKRDRCFHACPVRASPLPRSAGFSPQWPVALPRATVRQAPLKIQMIGCEVIETWPKQQSHAT